MSVLLGMYGIAQYFTGGGANVAQLLVHHETSRSTSAGKICVAACPMLKTEILGGRLRAREWTMPLVLKASAECWCCEGGSQRRYPHHWGVAPRLTIDQFSAH